MLFCKPWLESVIAASVVPSKCNNTSVLLTFHMCVCFLLVCAYLHNLLALSIACLLLLFLSLSQLVFPPIIINSCWPSSSTWIHSIKHKTMYGFTWLWKGMIIKYRIGFDPGQQRPEFKTTSQLLWYYTHIHSCSKLRTVISFTWLQSSSAFIV